MPKIHELPTYWELQVAVWLDGERFGKDIDIWDYVSKSMEVIAGDAVELGAGTGFGQRDMSWIFASREEGDRLWWKFRDCSLPVASMRLLRIERDSDEAFVERRWDGE